MKIILTAQFDKTDVDALKALAAREDMTVSQIIRRAVREYMERQRPLQRPNDRPEVQEQAAA